MKTCPNCNNSVEDEALFCDCCGMKIPEEMLWKPESEFIFCTNCGKKCTSDSTFCDGCGASLAEKPESITANETAYNFANCKRQSAKLSTMSKKLPLIGGFVAIVLIIFCIINFLVLPMFPKKAAIYMKEHELFYTDFSGKPVQITKELLPREYREDEGRFTWSYLYNESNFISKDGKMIVYPDNITVSEDNTTTDIYFRNMNKKDAEPIKIARVSRLEYININDEGNLVTYKAVVDNSLRNNAVLCQYDVKSEEKIKLISDEVLNSADLSTDGNIVYYVTQDSETDNDNKYNFYIKENGKDKEKIDSSVMNYSIISDYQTVYYIKEDNLYKKELGKEKVKVASNVSSLIKAYKEGVYYIKREDKEYSLSEFVHNDLGREAPEGLMEEKIKFNEYTVFFFDGSKENILGKTIGNYEGSIWGGMSVNYAISKPIALFNIKIDSDKKPKINLSEMMDGYEYIYDFDEVKDNIKEEIKNRQPDIECCVYEGKNLKGIISDKIIADLSMNEDGSKIYFLGELSEFGFADLYEATAKSGYKPQIIDSEVFDIRQSTEEGVYYSKDRTDVNFSLYKDKKMIDEVLSYSFNIEGDTARYVKDGDIYLYNNGKKEKLGIAGEEVPVSKGISNGNFLFIADYNPKYRNGELYRYKEGKIEKLESDANYILDTNLSERSNNNG